MANKTVIFKIKDIFSSKVEDTMDKFKKFIYESYGEWINFSIEVEDSKKGN